MAAALEEEDLERFTRLLVDEGTRRDESSTEDQVRMAAATSRTDTELGSSGSTAAERPSKPVQTYKLKNPIVWMDLEMTGLDALSDHIMEIAVLITDGELTGPHLERWAVKLADELPLVRHAEGRDMLQGPDLILHLPEDALASMNEWCKTTHGNSGLVQACRESRISLRDAEDQVLEFLQQHTQTMEEPGDPQHKAHLAGNSIYVDRAFLQRHMPRVHAHLHWRLIDVSTLLELARRWYPTEFRKQPKKKLSHKAMADIRESLNELKFYRRAIFKPAGVSYREYLSMHPQGGRKQR